MNVCGIVRDVWGTLNRILKSLLSGGEINRALKRCSSCGHSQKVPARQVAFRRSVCRLHFVRPENGMWGNSKILIGNAWYARDVRHCVVLVFRAGDR